MGRVKRPRTATSCDSEISTCDSEESCSSGDILIRPNMPGVWGKSGGLCSTSGCVLPVLIRLSRIATRLWRHDRCGHEPAHGGEEYAGACSIPLAPVKKRKLRTTTAKDVLLFTRGPIRTIKPPGSGEREMLPVASVRAKAGHTRFSQNVGCISFAVRFASFCPFI